MEKVMNPILRAGRRCRYPPRCGISVRGGMPGGPSVVVIVMGIDARHRSARTALERLARSRMDNDVFRWEAAEVLRRAVGFDTWGWAVLDPANADRVRFGAQAHP